MLTNYHTHIYRCNHASGTEREYVEKAIKEGMCVLGLSDHAPYLFDGTYYSGHRMRPEEFGEYVQIIRDLQKEYAGQITLLAGVEIEYYPRNFHRTAKFLAEHDCDYMILGQHFVGMEETHTYQAHNRDVFERYIDQCIEGMETGMMTYLCHPDVCTYLDDDRVREKGFTRLFEAAKRLDVPVEINMYGMVDGRHYPRASVFRIAAEIGNEVVFGYDAHEVRRLGDKDEYRQVCAIAEEAGVTFTQLTPERVLSRKHLIG